MGAITGTLVKATEFGGDYKVVKLTIVPAAASDTVTLTLETHGITEILAVIPSLTAGYDAALAGIFATFTGLSSRWSRPPLLARLRRTSRLRRRT